MQWHDYLALTLFAVAAVIVVRRAYRAVWTTPEASCGSGCGTCSSSSSAGSRRADQLLTIGGPPTGTENR